MRIRIVMVATLAALAILSGLVAPHAQARATVVQVTYVSQVSGLEDLVLTIYGFGLPGVGLVDLEWSGTLVLPSSSSLPPGVSGLGNCDVSGQDLGHSQVLGGCYLVESTNPLLVGSYIAFDIQGQTGIVLWSGGPELLFFLEDVDEDYGGPGDKIGLQTIINL